MDGRTRLILALLMSSVMVLMVTLLVTLLNLGLGFRFPGAMGQGLSHRLAGGGGHRLPGDAAGAPPERADHRPARWSAADAVRARAGAGRSRPASFRPRAVVDLCGVAIAAREREIGAFAALDLEAGKACRRAAQLAALAAAWAPDRRQGHLRHRRFSDRLRFADLCRPPPGRRRGDGDAGAACRRHRARQDGDQRIRFASAGNHAQSAQSRAHDRHILGGVGRGGCRRHAAACARQPDRQLDRPAGRLLRGRRFQAVLPPDAHRRHEMLLLVARHRRPVRCRHRRCGLCRRRSQRTRSARR